jgi:hypothetical protein
MKRKVRKIISGGQTGADRGGLDAAIELGIPHGGWCPRGRRAEDGAIPARYLLRETNRPGYPERTERNVLAADGTVVFTFGKPEGGSALTWKLARRHGKPRLHLDLRRRTPQEAARRLRAWIEKERLSVLNVAGSRESGARGMRELVWKIVTEAFEQPERVRRARARRSAGKGHPSRRAGPARRAAAD